jgi:hypothetical protein
MTRLSMRHGVEDFGSDFAGLTLGPDRPIAAATAAAARMINAAISQLQRRRGSS